MTLSFHKVMFSAQEVLDMVADSQSYGADLDEFVLNFWTVAEERSRENR